MIGAVVRRSAAALAACSLLLSITSASAQTLPSSLVYLRDIDPTIAQDIRYASDNNFTGRPLPGYDAAECILTRPAAQALKQVQADLAAARLGLKVYDCYRPARATRAMVQWVHNGRSENPRYYPRLKKPTLLAGYIATYSRHATGTAIDLTLVALGAPAPAVFDSRASYGACTASADQRSPDSSVDMGTGYDCFDLMSNTNNASVSADARKRRMQLVAAMNRRGFRNYHREWWHFTFSGSPNIPAHDFTIARRRDDTVR